MYDNYLLAQANTKATWSEHIAEICSSANKRVNILRSLKFYLDRNTLNIIYKTHIRPMLEYSSAVWDNCTVAETERLEKVQNEAARIVTGLPRYCSLRKLYEEIGWESLSTRREKHKLTIYYKMVNGLCPEYLTSLIPPERGHLVTYNIRNADLLTPLPCRTQLYYKSFLPATTRLWNGLDPDIRGAPTLASFQTRLRLRNFPKQPPKWFEFGSRKTNIIHAKLRNSVSDLNAHLFKFNLVPNQQCMCGETVESTSHYFLHCKRYTAERLSLFQELLPLCHVITLKLLLFGDENLNHAENTRVVENVHKFIRESKRFV